MKNESLDDDSDDGGIHPDKLDTISMMSDTLAMQETVSKRKESKENPLASLNSESNKEYELGECYQSSEESEVDYPLTS